MGSSGNSFPQGFPLAHAHFNTRPKNARSFPSDTWNLSLLGAHLLILIEGEVGDGPFFVAYVPITAPWVRHFLVPFLPDTCIRGVELNVAVLRFQGEGNLDTDSQGV